MTSAQFQAISQTPSSVTFNIQVPSEQTIIDRRVLWSSQVCLKLTVAYNAANGGNAGQLPLNYGLTDALAPFPLHQLATVMTATINNNCVSLNVRDVLPSYLRFMERRELQRYNGYTTVAPDLVAEYAEAVGTGLNPLGSWANATDNDLFQRGAFSLIAITTTPPSGGTITVTNPVPIAAAGAGASQDIYVVFQVSEPLLISPFIAAHPQSNNQGMYGVQNMNMVFNIGDATRVWRTASNQASVGATPFGATWLTAASVFSFTNSRLIFNFLTPHPSDLLPARNAVPYYELPRFITSNLASISPVNRALPALASANLTTVQTSSLQINQVPDRLIISVRNPLSSTAWGQADAQLCIAGVSINFNNQSGILASATPQDLYRYSVENGSNQSWYEFSGYSNVPDNITGMGKKLAGSGSLLVLEFGKDIQLTEDYYSSGSLGNFNLQIQLQVYNQFSYAITPEICLITMNSGIFVNERGTSSTYTGILTKQDVLEASAQEPLFQSSVKRLVGGGFMDSMKSLIRHAMPHVLPHALKYGKEQLGKSSHPGAKMAHDAMQMAGLGASGGGPSGGGPSGGRSKLAERLMR